MGNACDCASLVFGAKGGGGGGGGASFGSGLGGSGGINRGDAAALEARRAFESYSDYSGDTPNAHHRNGTGSPHGEDRYSDEVDFNSNSGGLVDELGAAGIDDGAGGGAADGSGDAGRAEALVKTSSSSSLPSSAAASTLPSASKELVPSAQYGPALLSGDQEEKMWEDLRHDLQVLDDELAQDASNDSLSLESLTTHLRGFVRDENGVPVLAAGRKGRADVTLEPSAAAAAAASDRDRDLLSSRSIVQEVVAEAEDALAGLAEFEDDDYGEDGM